MGNCIDYDGCDQRGPRVAVSKSSSVFLLRSGKKLSPARLKKKGGGLNIGEGGMWRARSERTYGYLRGRVIFENTLGNLYIMTAWRW